MKRPEPSIEFVDSDLIKSPKKMMISRSLSDSKTSRILPIKDQLIAKLLLHNPPEKYITQLSTLSDSLQVKYSIKSDTYTSYFEISCMQSEKIKENFDTFAENVNNIIQEIQKNIKEVSINCNSEEYASLQKKITKGVKLLDVEEIRFLGLQDYSKKPLILKEFIINEIIAVNLVLIENSPSLGLDTCDNLVINFEKCGVFLDDFMQQKAICSEICKFFKKNKSFYQKDEIFEANTSEFKVFLQIFEKDEEKDEKLKKYRAYISQILNRILLNKQYINLYYPLPVDLEKEIIKTFIQELIDFSNDFAEESNFLTFPTKFSFICHEKQKDLVLEIFERIRANFSLDDKIQDIKHGGRWHINSYNNHQVGIGAMFGGGLLPNSHQNVKQKYLPKNVSKIIEKSYILGEMQGFLLINDKELKDLCVDPYNRYTNLKKPGHRNRINAYDSSNGSNSNDNLNNNMNNTDEITIDLKMLTESSKITTTYKLVQFDEHLQEYQYFDIISNCFQSYETDINKALLFLNKIKEKKLVYRLDFETMKPAESLYLFDLKTFQLKKDGPLPNQSNNNNRNAAGQLFPPFIPNDPGNGYPISRKTDKKYDKFLQKTMSLLIKKDNGIRITEPQDEKPLNDSEIFNKSPQLLCRSLDDVNKLASYLSDLLKKKSISFSMKINKSSQLLQKTLEKLCFRNNIHTSFVDKSLRLFGNRKTINNLLQEIQKILEMNLEDAIFPVEWEPQTENLKECDLKPEAFEFLEISKSMTTTAPHIEIIKITRIQNKKLWENYVFERKRLEFKGNATEKMLFHGTRNNDPQNIYCGIEEGFDVRLANHGMVGKGIYFAEAASYSVGGFAHHKSNGNFDLLYANVLIGNSFDSAGGGNYVMPPLLPNDSNLRYDSIRTGTNYTIYNSNRAYPAYLIEYKIGNNANFGQFMFGNPVRQIPPPALQPQIMQSFLKSSNPLNNNYDDYDDDEYDEDQDLEDENNE